MRNSTINSGKQRYLNNQRKKKMHLFACSRIPDMMHIYIYMYVWTQNFGKKGFQDCRCLWTKSPHPLARKGYVYIIKQYGAIGEDLWTDTDHAEDLAFRLYTAGRFHFYLALVWSYGLCEHPEHIFLFRFTWKKSSSNTPVHLKSTFLIWTRSHAYISKVSCVSTSYIWIKITPTEYTRLWCRTYRITEKFRLGGTFGGHLAQRKASFKVWSSCSGSSTVECWLSPRMEIPQPLWATLFGLQPLVASA